MTVIDFFATVLGIVLVAFAVLGAGLSLWQIHEENDGRTAGQA